MSLFFLSGFTMRNLGFMLVLLGIASAVLAACVTNVGEKNIALFCTFLGLVVGGLVLWLDFSDEVKTRKADLEELTRRYNKLKEGQ